MMTPRRRAGALLGGLLASALLLAAPGVALGAIDWTITRSPSSVLAMTKADFSLVAINIGSGGKKSAIGCIIVSIPSQFTVNSAVVTDASGHSWSVSFVNSGPATTVTVQAASDKERLTAKNVESISFKVNVTAGLIPGAYQWTANAYNGHACTGTFGQPTALTVTIGVGSVNHPPVAVADLATLVEDTTLVTAAPGLLGNDLDIDGDPLTAHLVTGPVHGTLSLASDGSFTYAPFVNFAGADSFSYRASDGVAYSPSAVVSLTVTPVNDPPVAVGDSYSVNEGASLATPAPGVLANDHDVDSPLLTAQLVVPPAHGTLTLLATGSFTYAPYAGFSGSDSFQYRASDGSATSAPAMVNLTVVPVAGSPTPSPSSSGASPGATPGSSSGDSPAESATPGPDGSPLSSPGPGQNTGSGGSGSPAPTPALTLARAPNDPIAPLSLDFAFAGMQFDWFIPGLAIGGPGLLVIAAIALQLFGALAWLPAVRRYLGGSDPRRRRRPA